MRECARPPRRGGGRAGWTHHTSLGLSIVHVGIEKHSCVIVGCLQCDGQSITAILQTSEGEGALKVPSTLQSEMDRMINIIHGCSFSKPFHFLCLWLICSFQAAQLHYPIKKKRKKKKTIQNVSSSLNIAINIK